MCVDIIYGFVTLLDEVLRGDGLVFVNTTDCVGEEMGYREDGALGAAACVGD